MNNKKFTLSLLVLLVLFFSVFHLITNFVYSDKNQMFTANTLIIGASQGAAGLREKYFENSINACVAGESTKNTYYKLSYLLKRNKYVTRVIYTVGPHSFLGNPSFTFSDMISYRFLYEDSEAGRKELWNNPINLFKYIVVDKILGIDSKTFALFFKIISNNFSVHDYPYFGGELYKDGKGQTEDIMFYTINLRFYNNNNLKYFSEGNLSLFSQIVDLCNQSNIELILIRMPTTTAYIENVPESIEEKFLEIIKEYNINNSYHFLDLKGKVFSDEYFSDYDHLNPEGAELVSMYISTLVENARRF